MFRNFGRRSVHHVIKVARGWLGGLRQAARRVGPLLRKLTTPQARRLVTGGFIAALLIGTPAIASLYVSSNPLRPSFYEDFESNPPEPSWADFGTVRADDASVLPHPIPVFDGVNDSSDNSPSPSNYFDVEFIQSTKRPSRGTRIAAGLPYCISFWYAQPPSASDAIFLLTQYNACGSYTGDPANPLNCANELAAGSRIRFADNIAVGSAGGAGDFMGRGGDAAYMSHADDWRYLAKDVIFDPAATYFGLQLQWLDAAQPLPIDNVRVAQGPCDSSYELDFSNGVQGFHNFISGSPLTLVDEDFGSGIGPRPPHLHTDGAHTTNVNGDMRGPSFPALPNQEYCLSGWVYWINGPSKPVLQIHQFGAPNGGNPFLGNQAILTPSGSTSVAATGAWGFYSGTLVTPPGTQSLRVGVGVIDVGPTGGEALYDDLRVAEGACLETNIADPGGPIPFTQTVRTQHVYRQAFDDYAATTAHDWAQLTTTPSGASGNPLIIAADPPSDAAHDPGPFAHHTTAYWYGGDYRAGIDSIDFTIDDVPGSDYCVSAWVKWESGGWPFLLLSERDGIGTNLDPGGYPSVLMGGFTGQGPWLPMEYTDGNGWVRYETTFTPNPSAAFGYLANQAWGEAGKSVTGVRVPATGSGGLDGIAGHPTSLYWDDLMVYEGACTGAAEGPTDVGLIRYRQTFDAQVHDFVAVGLSGQPTTIIRSKGTASADYDPENASLLVRNNHGGGDYYTDVAFPLLPYTPYCVGAWIKWEKGGWPGLGLDEYDSGGSFFRTFILADDTLFSPGDAGLIPHTDGTGWVFYDSEITTSATAHTGRLILQSWNGAGKDAAGNRITGNALPTSVLWDDVFIHRGHCGNSSTPPDEVQNATIYLEDWETDPQDYLQTGGRGWMHYTNRIESTCDDEGDAADNSLCEDDPDPFSANQVGLELTTPRANRVLRLHPTVTDPITEPDPPGTEQVGQGRSQYSFGPIIPVTPGRDYCIGAFIRWESGHAPRISVRMLPTLSGRGDGNAVPDDLGYQEILTLTDPTVPSTRTFWYGSTFTAPDQHNGLVSYNGVTQAVGAIRVVLDTVDGNNKPAPADPTRRAVAHFDDIGIYNGACAGDAANATPNAAPPGYRACSATDLTPVMRTEITFPGGGQCLSTFDCNVASDLCDTGAGATCVAGTCTCPDANAESGIDATFGGNGCACKYGYTGSPCLPVDECAGSNSCGGGTGSTCSDITPGYTCACNPGTEVSTGQKALVDDMITLKGLLATFFSSNSFYPASTTDSVLGFTPTSSYDFVIVPSGSAYVVTATASGTVVDTDGDLSIDPVAWRMTESTEPVLLAGSGDDTHSLLEPAGTLCVPIPAFSNCPDGTLGGCSCIPGYSGEPCAQDDECLLGSHNCIAGATCVNTPTNYTCDCPDPNAEGGINPGVGGFGCICKLGYSGNPCLDIDECAGTNGCVVGSTCLNADPGYTCGCGAGALATSQNTVFQDLLEGKRAMATYRARYAVFPMTLDDPDLIFNPTATGFTYTLTSTGLNYTLRATASDPLDTDADGVTGSADAVIWEVSVQTFPTFVATEPTYLGGGDSDELNSPGGLLCVNESLYPNTVCSDGTVASCRCAEGFTGIPGECFQDDPLDFTHHDFVETFDSTPAEPSWGGATVLLDASFPHTVPGFSVISQSSPSPNRYLSLSNPGAFKQPSKETAIRGGADYCVSLWYRRPAGATGAGFSLTQFNNCIADTNPAAPLDCSGSAAFIPIQFANTATIGGADANDGMGRGGDANYLGLTDDWYHTSKDIRFAGTATHFGVGLSWTGASAMDVDDLRVTPGRCEAIMHADFSDANHGFSDTDSIHPPRLAHSDHAQSFAGPDAPHLRVFEPSTHANLEMDHRSRPIPARGNQEYCVSGWVNRLDTPVAGFDMEDATGAPVEITTVTIPDAYDPGPRVLLQDLPTEVPYGITSWGVPVPDTATHACFRTAVRWDLGSAPIVKLLGYAGLDDSVTPVWEHEILPHVLTPPPSPTNDDRLYVGEQGWVQKVRGAAIPAGVGMIKIAIATGLFGKFANGDPDYTSQSSSTIRWDNMELLLLGSGTCNFSIQAQEGFHQTFDVLRNPSYSGSVSTVGTPHFQVLEYDGAAANGNKIGQQQLLGNLALPIRTIPATAAGQWVYLSDTIVTAPGTRSMALAVGLPDSGLGGAALFDDLTVKEGACSVAQTSTTPGLGEPIFHKTVFQDDFEHKRSSRLWGVRADGPNPVQPMILPAPPGGNDDGGAAAELNHEYALYIDQPTVLSGVATDQLLTNTDITIRLKLKWEYGGWPIIDAVYADGTSFNILGIGEVTAADGTGWIEYTTPPKPQPPGKADPYLRIYASHASGKDANGNVIANPTDTSLWISDIENASTAAFADPWYVRFNGEPTETEHVNWSQTNGFFRVTNGDTLMELASGQADAADKHPVEPGTPYCISAELHDAKTEVQLSQLRSNDTFLNTIDLLDFQPGPFPGEFAETFVTHPEAAQISVRVGLQGTQFNGIIDDIRIRRGACDTGETPHGTLQNEIVYLEDWEDGSAADYLDTAGHAWYHYTNRVESTCGDEGDAADNSLCVTDDDFLSANSLGLVHAAGDPGAVGEHVNHVLKFHPTVSNPQTEADPPGSENVGTARSQYSFSPIIPVTPGEAYCIGSFVRWESGWAPRVSVRMLPTLAGRGDGVFVQNDIGYREVFTAPDNTVDPLRTYWYGGTFVAPDITNGLATTNGVAQAVGAIRLVLDAVDLGAGNKPAPTDVSRRTVAYFDDVVIHEGACSGVAAVAGTGAAPYNHHVCTGLAPIVRDDADTQAAGCVPAIDCDAFPEICSADATCVASPDRCVCNDPSAIGGLAAEVHGVGCICAVGYAGPPCVLVDECTAGTGACSADSTCTDLNPQYSCDCDPSVMFETGQHAAFGDLLELKRLLVEHFALNGAYPATLFPPDLSFTQNATGYTFELDAEFDQTFTVTATATGATRDTAGDGLGQPLVWAVTDSTEPAVLSGDDNHDGADPGSLCSPLAQKLVFASPGPSTLVVPNGGPTNIGTFVVEAQNNNGDVAVAFEQSVSLNAVVTAPGGDTPVLASTGGTTEAGGEVSVVASRGVATFTDTTFQHISGAENAPIHFVTTHAAGQFLPTDADGLLTTTNLSINVVGTEYRWSGDYLDGTEEWLSAPSGVLPDFATRPLTVRHTDALGTPDADTTGAITLNVVGANAGTAIVSNNTSNFVAGEASFGTVGPALSISYTATVDHEPISVELQGIPGSNSASSHATTIEVHASQLTFTTPPGGSRTGQIMTQQPVVSAVDASGVVDLDFDELVTIVLTSPLPIPPATLPTVTKGARIARNGVADFLELTYTALDPFAPAPFVVTVDDRDDIGPAFLIDLPALVSGSITSDPAIVGQATSLTFSVQPTGVANYQASSELLNYMTASIVVEARDDFGNLATTPQMPCVELAVVGDVLLQGGATPDCDDCGEPAPVLDCWDNINSDEYMYIPLVGGVATFNNVQVIAGYSGNPLTVEDDHGKSFRFVARLGSPFTMPPRPSPDPVAVSASIAVLVDEHAHIGDIDGDLLIDSEEATLGTDPLHPDTDRDGCEDKVEFAYWVNKNIGVFPAALLNPDVDGDGYRDCLEELCLLQDLNNPDADSDGALDCAEPGPIAFYFGDKPITAPAPISDPNDFSSTPCAALLPGEVTSDPVNCDCRLDRDNNPATTDDRYWYKNNHATSGVCLPDSGFLVDLSPGDVEQFVLPGPTGPVITPLQNLVLLNTEGEPAPATVSVHSDGPPVTGNALVVGGVYYEVVLDEPRLCDDPGNPPCPPIEICVTYDDSNLTFAQEEALDFFHFDGATSATDSILLPGFPNTEANLICGHAVTFSNFAVVAPEDNCPDNDYKLEPGACGCGRLDSDTDGDGLEDCRDGCLDADGDGYGVDSSGACLDPGDCAGTCIADDCVDTDATINPAGTEVCDGADNNCDGTVDETGNALCDNGLFCDGAETCGGTSGCLAGTPPSIDDGIGCTDDSCDEANDTIINTANDANCDNGLFCDGVETCSATLDCQTGLAPNLDDGVGCTDDSCDEVNDVVVNAANDANCDNGLFCDGSETCDLTLDCLGGVPPSTDDGVGCTDDSCDEVNDVIVNAANDANCDNGLFCDGAETCDATLDCQSGAAPSADDGVGCTDDSCDELNDVIVNAANDANCDNGLFCDGAETCDATLDCQAGTAPSTDDGVGCTDDSCDEVNDVIVNAANDASCDNGLFCDGAETCDATLDCQAGTAPSTDDGVGCTDDSCDEANDVIVNTANDANCDNGLFCDGAETCDATLDCQAGTAPSADDGVGCTDDSCDEVNDVIVNTANDANCDNGLFCDGAETCDTTLDCQAGTAPSIDDGVGCTDDSCDEANDVIVNTANNANCDNGLFCDGAETCDASLDCQAGTAPSTDDGVGCTDDSCDEANDVIVNAANDANCDNGLFCDGAETCDASLDCQAGTAPSTDDGVGCTDDSCDEANDVIVNAANDANCDNGLFCDGAETCDATLDCQAGTAPSTDDGVGCTDDSCDEVNDQIIHLANNANCDNGLFCDGAETCDLVADCQAGTAPTTDDGVGCTDDSCDEVNDIIVNTANDANCDNGQFCDGSETCDAALDCQAGTAPTTDDGVGCTDDSCDEVNDIIVNTANDANCDNGLFCDGSETCDAALDCQTGTNPCAAGETCDDLGDICVPAGAEVCDDGIDNDGDTYVDCLDGDDCTLPLGVQLKRARLRLRGSKPRAEFSVSIDEFGGTMAADYRDGNDAQGLLRMTLDTTPPQVLLEQNVDFSVFAGNPQTPWERWSHWALDNDPADPSETTGKLVHSRISWQSHVQYLAKHDPVFKAKPLGKLRTKFIHVDETKFLINWREVTLPLDITIDGTTLISVDAAGNVTVAADAELRRRGSKRAYVTVPYRLVPGQVIDWTSANATHSHTIVEDQTVNGGNHFTYFTDDGRLYVTAPLHVNEAQAIKNLPAGQESITVELLIGECSGDANDTALGEFTFTFGGFGDDDSSSGWRGRRHDHGDDDSSSR